MSKRNWNLVEKKSLNVFEWFGKGMVSQVQVGEGLEMFEIFYNGAAKVRWVHKGRRNDERGMCLETSLAMGNVTTPL